MRFAGNARSAVSAIALLYLFDIMFFVDIVAKILVCLGRFFFLSGSRRLANSKVCSGGHTDLSLFDTRWVSPPGSRLLRDWFRSLYIRLVIGCYLSFLTNHISLFTYGFARV